MDKDNDYWYFDDDDVELFNQKHTKEELLELPIGTKITTDLKEHNVFVKTCENEFKSDDCEIISDYDIKDDLSIKDKDYGTKILKIEIPTYETIYDTTKEVKEMTMNEICKELGYNVKIIKEKN